MQNYFPTILLLLSLAVTGCASFGDLGGGSGGEYDPHNPFSRDPASVLSSRERDLEVLARKKARLEQAISDRTLTLGMRMGDVHSLWGEPRVVENAGYAGNGNERWIYYDGLSSRWSMSTARIVYFEGGQVVGWETNPAR